MAKSRIMTGFNGWVAFYNLTPESVLEDLGVNEGVNKDSFCKGAGAKHLRIFNQEILRPSAEILSANSMTNAQNDKVSSLAPCGRGLGRGVEQEPEILRPSTEILSTNLTTNAQNDMRANVCTLTPALSKRERVQRKSPLPPFTKGGNIPAFTLAEVLVTLGIIGIVAAMTLPGLIKNYRNNVSVTVLKSDYSKIMQGFRAMLSKEQVEELGYVLPFLQMTKSTCSIPADVDNEKCKPLWDAFGNYFGARPVVAQKDVFIVRMDNKTYASASYLKGYKYFAMPSGLHIIQGSFNRVTKVGNKAKIAELGGQMYTYQGAFTVDTNGPASPNKLGRDVFMFKLAGDGRLYAHSSRDYAVYDGQLVGLLYWPGYNRCGRKLHSTSGLSTTTGEGCTARLIENNWVMDY